MIQVLPQVAPGSPYISKKAILASVFTICLVVLTAGLGYYIFKQKNDPFRFQYFKVRKTPLCAVLVLAFITGCSMVQKYTANQAAETQIEKYLEKIIDHQKKINLSLD